MTKLKIISRLWSVIYDLKMLVNGTGKKSMDDIDKELDIIEMHCRRYTDVDDAEDIQGGGYMVFTRAEPY